MAAPFSSTSPHRSIVRPIRNPPKSFLSHSGCFQKGFDCVKCRSINLNVYSWSWAASYASLRHEAFKLSGKPVAVNHLLLKRVGIVRCATIEEIEAEKSSIEKDAKARMEKTIETVRMNFNSIRTGKANPAMPDKVEEFSKVVAEQAEEGKVAVRNIRRDALKAYEKLEKEKKLSEDNVKDLSSDLQKLTDEYMKKIDSLCKQKEKELLTV